MLYAAPALDDDDRRVVSEIDRLYATFARSTGGSATREWVGGVRKQLLAVDRLRLGERVVPALYAAAIGELRRETYQAEEGVTRDQAVRDIRRLERAGLLRAVNYGATLHYLAAGELKNIADEETAKVTGPAIEPYPG